MFLAPAIMRKKCPSGMLLPTCYAQITEDLRDLSPYLIEDYVRIRLSKSVMPNGKLNFFF